MKISDKDKLQIYIDLLPFVSACLGENAEIVIHDLMDENKSLIAIENPLSGRKIGSPITDLASELVHKGDEEHLDYIANYQAKSKGKDFVSYTYFIKNDNRIIGLMCINKDTNASNIAIDAIMKLIEQNNLSFHEENNYFENLVPSVQDFVNEKIMNVINEENVRVDHMSVKTKISIVRKLDEQGILKQKGAINEVAKQLKVSVPTIYRYLKN